MATSPERTAKNPWRWHAGCAAACVATLVMGEAWAGGLFLYETGTDDMATASAGWAARAQDASTVMTNPAGMMRLQNDELLVTAQVLYSGLEFSANSNSTYSGDSGEPIGTMPAGSLFYVRGINPDMKFGIGVYGNFGLGLDYDDNWAGRYYVQDTTLIGVNISPALAFKIDEHWSIGAALVAMYSNFEYKTAVNNVDPGFSDGQLEIKDNDWGYGGNLGVLYSPSATSRYGLTYTSKVDLDFSDQPQLSNLGPAFNFLLSNIQNLDLSMTVPQTLTASLYHELDDRWALLGNVRWEDWSQFGKVDVGVTTTGASADVTTEIPYDDTWQVALGAQYRLSDAWRLGFGAAYDSSMLGDAQRSPSLPVGDAWRLGFGALFHRRPNMDIGLAYTLMLPGDLSVDQERGPLAGRIAGEYDSTAAHFFAANFRWRY